LNRLWAPWRINYVTRKNISGCIFCRILNKKNDKKNFVVLRSRGCFVVLNTFPYNNGHLMVVINRHVASLENLNNAEILDMNLTVIKMLKILKRVLKPEGFNIGINLGTVSGAGIDKHLHIHLVPRWKGDTNFMPIVSNTKIISQGLNDLYLKMKHVINQAKYRR
jgi:ATP adenylyltransferase